MHSNGVDEPIVVYNDATTTNKNWLYADHLGSIVALANTTGAATANYTYSPEGKQGGSTPICFGYTGQQNLSGLGVQYYKARMYSADLGRFIQTDPIGMADDMNLYVYVGNNAVNRTDPSGRAQVAFNNGFSGQSYNVAGNMMHSPENPYGTLTADNYQSIPDTPTNSSIAITLFGGFIAGTGQIMNIAGTKYGGSAGSGEGMVVTGLLILSYGVGYGVGTVINDQLDKHNVNFYDLLNPVQAGSSH